MDDLLFHITMPQFISFITLGGWLFLFLTGREQLNCIVRRTETLVLERTKAELKNNPNLTLDELYKLVLPEWQQMIRKCAWYVTHKTELFPIPAIPDLVMKRIDMNANYVGRILVGNHIVLDGYEFKKVEKELLKHGGKTKHV